MFQIGVDIGGTNIKAGIVDDKTMNIVSKRTLPFPKGGYEAVCLAIKDTVDDMQKEIGMRPDDAGSLGIAVPGSIDPTGDIVIDAHNLGFHNVPIKKEISRLFPELPVYIGNDANVAALAELHAGAFKGAKTAVLLTLGTGVGGGVILGGKMFNGGRGNGVELGHMMLIYGGDLCTCGNRGCIESYCTATWLTQQGQRLVTLNKDSLVCTMSGNDIEKVNAKTVIDAAKKNDRYALEIFDIFLDNLSAAITSVNALLDPEIIALGGGVSLAGDFLYTPLRKLVKEKSFFNVDYSIVPAVRGNDAGIIGAAMLCKN